MRRGFVGGSVCDPDVTGRMALQRSSHKVRGPRFYRLSRRLHDFFPRWLRILPVARE